MPAKNEALLKYKDPSIPAEERVEDLLSRMTLEEKVGQLSQLCTRKMDPEQVKRLIREGKIGSRILADTPFAGNEDGVPVLVRENNELNRVAVEESRLGIPLIFGRDVIHGHRTVFPIPLAQAASWDPAMVEEAASIAAKEAAADSVHWTFAPMVDIARDPRWSRIIEGFGEDPHLAGEMAAAAVKGFQGRKPGDLAESCHILACLKHFAGYGAAEGGRDYNTTEISDNTLRNIYLEPFRKGVQAGAGSLMSAFNDLNGTPASGNRYLLTEVLRNEWGFKGFVVSDWGAIAELKNHRICDNGKDSAEIAMNAGVDMDMCSNVYMENMAALVKGGLVPLERLDAAVRAILRAKFALGLFEKPYIDENLSRRVQFLPEHRAAARKLAARSMVLLKNDGNILPLPRKGKTIAVVGPFIDERRSLLGSWTLDGRAEETPTIAEAFRAALPEANVRFASAAEDIPSQVIRSDIAVLVVGESHSRTGENASVAEIDLPWGQNELIRNAASWGKPLILVVCAGRPVALNEAVRHAGAIIYAWHGGTETAGALVDIILGKVNPSGKIPVSFPRTTGQIPIHYNHKSTGRPYVHQAWYRDIDAEPLFSFGHGLSYTSFAYWDFMLGSKEISADGTVEAKVKVTNTGNKAGEEVVQCYIQDCVSKITRPVRELKGFTRVLLQPGETKTTAFKLTGRELGYYGPEGKWVVEPGKFKVWIGGSSRADLGGEFTVV
ncbi:MAG: glycoside hydrolase family 3 N-terminal domain-containing protein [Bacillota bacterium]